VPFQAAQQFEIGQTTVPAIENHQFWLKSALFGLLDHLLKVIILTQTILGLVVQAKVTRQPALAICPEQRDQPVAFAEADAIGVMRWCLFICRMGLRGFNAAKYSLGRYQKVDVIHFVTFWRVHALSLECTLSIA
jgi:hypothetical protein